MYLVKRELKEDTYKLVVVYKEVLKGIFEKFCKMPTGNIVNTPVKVFRRPTFKDAAKLVMQQGRRRSSSSQPVKTANGLQSAPVRSAIEKNQESAETVKVRRDETSRDEEALDAISSLTPALVVVVVNARRLQTRLFKETNDRSAVPAVLHGKRAHRPQVPQFRL